MEAKVEFRSIESIQDLKVPQKTVVISGDNGVGKSAFLKEYALNYGYAFYEEHGITSGKERLAAIVEFCKAYDNVVIDDIELHLHTDVQQELLGTLHDNNSNLCIICSTHSPSIIINGWLDVIVNLDDTSSEEKDDVLSNGKYAVLAEKYKNLSFEKIKTIADNLGFSDNYWLVKLVLAFELSIVYKEKAEYVSSTEERKLDLLKRLLKEDELKFTELAEI